MLHITNGQAAAGKLAESGVPGSIITWDDVLHVGPVPADLDMAELRAIRAQAIADRGWTSFTGAHQRLIERDNGLEAAETVDEIVLWFEHDLYDQLQLLQILDQLDRWERLSLICIGEYPGIDRFLGLGQLSPADFSTLFPMREAVIQAQVTLAKHAWMAFRAAEPVAWSALLREDTTALPFLNGAILRWLEELPDSRSGLTRSQRQILAALDLAASPVDLFRITQAREQRPYLGDTSFFDILQAMAELSGPLLSPFSGPGEPIERLPAGDAVLAGRSRWLGNWRHGVWWGGVCQGAPSWWAWDSSQQAPVQVAPTPS